MSTYDDPAFPQPATSDGHAANTPFAGGDLSKRELFAAMAMQGLLSSLGYIRSEQWQNREISEYAVFTADTLLAELAKEQPDEWRAVEASR